MAVERLQRIHARCGFRRYQMQVLDRAQVAEVEDRTDVDEERVVSLPGEDLLASRQRMQGFFFQLRVIRRRARADVAGRAGEPLGEDLGVLAVDPRHGV